MKAKDTETLNKVILAINVIIPNIDISVDEVDDGINIQFLIPKTSPVGRPRKLIGIDSVTGQQVGNEVITQ